MALTRTKLDEARFFCLHLENARSKLPDFDYFLSAFVSAARSVTFILQSEYAHVSGFPDWYKSKALSDDRLLSAMNSVRVRAVHTKPLSTNLLAQVAIPPIKDESGVLAALLPTEVPGEVEVVPLDGSAETAARLRGTRPVALCTVRETFRHLDDFPGQDVLLTCRQYLSFLESIVSECEGRFAL